MAARVRVGTTFPAAPADLVADVFDIEFHRAKLAAIGGPGAVLETFDQASDGALHVALRLVLHRSKLPAIARPFAPAELPLRRTEVWTRAGAAPTCRFDVAVTGVPLRTHGSVTFRPAGAGTRVTVDVTARVTIPFVGRAVQGVVTEVLRTLADDELRFAQDWFSATR